ncbi:MULTISPECIES: transcription antitermination factor NusB [Enterococcus]|jgi:N utilization substance protein B|uniref:Transcription antitermination protein NusB n=2 Tax=Enterococcus TaxID=1350 RepID=S0KJL8_9ENTE|nr:transcription antitermination factor NusB [Enterococcus dispar]EOT41185.1 transcription antitermination factor NusB [Enterococcus dispar ATCC 51266]EOW87181.1 transcription antitermination factor NusB [Enterococcus dispar ATCC 51266]MCU7356491.1 transcription antitermination factor NusB [Enterococcus dispar]MDT2704469.1 transcription antitermination factor NusB [Enterococcus dispar]WCG33775.1 transcription antitermination factor NusB [Enterococcus dispar]
MSKELSRHEIRKMALQALFPLDFNQDLDKKDAIMQAIELEHHEMVDEEQENFVPAYLDKLVAGVCEHKADLDELIQKHLKKGWSIKRLSKMDLCILRIASYEMMYETNVPNKVALNEALELTKTFSDDQSRKFVNGVLSAINTDLTKEA